ncbi:hypothetical protein, partial [Suilimivivens sp.]|uniref:hypothetical protein n=1 Tax=Suilimivivens sp. TaxID=2981669 RepID=UPI003077D8C2
SLPLLNPQPQSNKYTFSFSLHQTEFLYSSRYVPSLHMTLSVGVSSKEKIAGEVDQAEKNGTI